MRATFFYDIRFIKADDGYYSRYGITNDLMQRYMDIFDDFTYFARRENITESNKKYIIPKNKITKFKVETFEPNWKDASKRVNEALNNTDIAIIRLPSFIGYIAQNICRKRKITYLIEVVGNAFEGLWYHGGIVAKLIAFPSNLIMKNAIKKSKFVTYITEEYLQKCYPTKGKSFNGIANVSLKLDPNIIEKRIQNIEELKKGLEEKEIIKIGLIGALNVRYKGHKTAIKALKIVSEKYPNVRLELLGQGDKKELEQVAEENGVKDKVKFCGSLPGGAPVMNWMDSLDIYVQPSITEGHGRAMVEAVSRGCIAFSSNVGGLSDTVKKEYQIKARDYKKLAELIIKAIEDKNYDIQNIKTEFQNIQKYETKSVEQRRKEAFKYIIENAGKESISGK